MEKTGKKELDAVFEKADDPLQQAEKTRAEIATKFRAMCTTCGIVVLKIPDLEQAIRAFVIRILMDIVKLTPSSEGPVDFKKLDLHNLFSFKQESPYFTFDEKILGLCKGLNVKDGEIAKMKDSIVDFLKSLEGVKKVFDEYTKEVGEIKDEAYDFVRLIDVKDGISEIYNQVKIGKRNLEKIFDVRGAMLMLGEAAEQIAEVIKVVHGWYDDPKFYIDFGEKARELVKKNITDMKKVVWETTNEQKLEKSEDWENNFDYRVVGQLQK
jgi:hypothetical protein